MLVLTDREVADLLTRAMANVLGVTMAAFEPIPSEVRSAGEGPGEHVDFFPLALTRIGDEHFPGVRIEGDLPRISQPERPDFWAYARTAINNRKRGQRDLRALTPSGPFMAGRRRRPEWAVGSTCSSERIVTRNAIRNLPGDIDVDAKQLAEEGAAILRIVVRIPTLSAIPMPM